jgi:hypothetical protein
MEGHLKGRPRFIRGFEEQQRPINSLDVFETLAGL